jgi:hypothetical protein
VEAIETAYVLVIVDNGIVVLRDKVPVSVDGKFEAIPSELDLYAFGIIKENKNVV